jgi:hypothetical protein
VVGVGEVDSCGAHLVELMTGTGTGTGGRVGKVDLGAATGLDTEVPGPSRPATVGLA